MKFDSQNIYSKLSQKSKVISTRDVMQRSIIKKKDFNFKARPYVVGSKDGQQLSEPQISLKKDAQGKVVQIQVTCTCGREINIDCQ